jgi:predicted MFS family arabinose efflux permease
LGHHFLGIGYALNLFVVPVLALAGSWELAALLMLLERMVKAIRTPAREAMLSHATTVVGLIGAGYADFPLIAYHFDKAAVARPDWIPILYAVAMGVDAVAALILGRLFDRLGLSVIMTMAVLSSLFTPLVFLGGFDLALLGMVLWGIGMGAQESTIKTALAEMVPQDRRATGYGIFNTGFGLLWFLGSALMGILYDVSIWSLNFFSIIMQLCSVPLFLKISKEVCFVHR